MREGKGSNDPKRRFRLPLCGNGRRDLAGSGARWRGIFRTDSIREDVDMVTARINYHFHWGGRAIIGRY